MIVILILLGLITPLVVVEPLQDSIVLPKLATTATFTGLALVFGAVQLARDRWPPGRWPLLLWVALIAFVVVNVLAWAFAEDWRWSLMGERLRYQGLLTTVTYVLLFGVAAVAVRTPGQLRWLLFGLFISATGASIYALIQEAGLDWYEDFWAASVAERPAATLGQANAFGAYLVAMLAASSYLLFAFRERWQRAAVGVGLALMLFALFFTVSRSAFIAGGALVLLAGIAAFIFVPELRERLKTPAARSALAGAIVLPLLLALAGVFLIGLPEGRVSVLSEANSQAVEGRLSLWGLGFEMAGDRPLLGHGQDAFPIMFAEYRDQPDLPGIGTDNVEPESAHNLLVDIASGTGALGLAAFVFLVAAVLGYGLRRAFITRDASRRGALLALTGGVLGYLMAVFFGFAEAMTSWLLWLLLGALAGLIADLPPGPTQVVFPDIRGNDAPRDLPADERPRTLAAGAAAIVLALAGVGLLGWAATLVAADLSAAQAQEARARGEYRHAADLAERAVRLNPYTKPYLAQQASFEANTNAQGSAREEALEQALDTYQRLVSRFRPSSTDVLNLALTEYDLAELEDRSTAAARLLIERAVELDPFNHRLRQFVADFYERNGFEEEAMLHRIAVLCWSQECP